MKKDLTLYQSIQKNSLKPYNTKKAIALILLIKKGKDKEKINQYKYELFLILSKIVFKAVNNFYSICKKAGVKEEKLLHEEEDVTAECYLILNNCLEKLNLKYLNVFYFYYNSSLNKCMFRLYKKNYEKHTKVIINSDENEKSVLGNLQQTQHFNLIDIDLKNFTQLELDIIAHKIKNGKLREFLIAKNIKTNVYYETFEVIKKKLIDLYSIDKKL